MGSDGAHGLLKLRQAGAHTVAQDQETCVVFGMPRVAIELGAAELTSPLDQIAGDLIHWLSQIRKAA
jgi:two-component system chemotaxis response regulator CheB